MNIEIIKQFKKSIKLIYDFQAKNAGLIYHVWDHTEQVTEAAENILKRNSKLYSDENLLLIKIASIGHDLGNIIRRDEHEFLSSEYAKSVLPYFGFDKSSIDIVSDLILATRFPHKPSTELQKIICDADMSLMGQDNWLEKIEGYRIELGITDKNKWYLMQKGFLENHRWHTQEAHQLYNDQKIRNLNNLTRLL